MKKIRPSAMFFPFSMDSGNNSPLCPYMRLNTLEKIYLALRDLEPEIILDEGLRQRALKPVEAMLALGS
jgi:quinolinate synthase